MYLTDTSHRVAAFGPQKKTTKTKPKQRSNMFKCSLAENVTAHAGTHSTLYLPLSLPLLDLPHPFNCFSTQFQLLLNKRNETKRTQTDEAEML